MNCKSINFAEECEFSVLCNAEDIPDGFTAETVQPYQVVESSLFLGENAPFQVDILGNRAIVLDTLNEYRNRSLLRVDKLDRPNGSITLRLLYFSGYERFDDFPIIIDDAADADLRKNRIDGSVAEKELIEQLVLDNQYCFLLGKFNPDGQMTLIGPKMQVQIGKTRQNYLHVIGIQRTYGSQNLRRTPVTMIRASIKICSSAGNMAEINRAFMERYNLLIAREDTSVLLDLWKSYDELDMERIREEASELGRLKYTAYKIRGREVTFSLAETFHGDFLQKEMSYVAIAKEAYQEDDPLNYEPRSAFLLDGTIDESCRGGREFVVALDEESTEGRTIPDSGFIVPSITGSNTQRNRRKTAQKDIQSGACRLPGLKVLLQSGEMIGNPGRPVPAITSRLLQRVFGKDNRKSFTDSQKEAIKAALNTPDIAVIQGPPGTGKTQVIRAIVERINENTDGAAKILISSTQHDAVDQAIRNVTYGGLPANRVMSRKRRRSDDAPIYRWVDSLSDACSNWLERNREMGEPAYRDVLALAGQVEQQENKLEKLRALRDLLEEDSYSYKTIGEVEQLIHRLNEDTGNQSQDMVKLSGLLKEQILEPSEFWPAGHENLGNLMRHLRCNCSDSGFSVPDYWSKLRRIAPDAPEAAELLQRFVADVIALKQLAASSAQQTAPDCREEIAAICNAIRKETELKSASVKPERELYELVWTFKHQLSNTLHVQGLISSYSKVNAATCQQAANPHLSATMKGFNDTYDYVIIDEAARSNPLDLMIPMSMGKRIILVGDHKQLPHMVEREIVERVEKKNPGSHAREVLEQSLFMRMFELVSTADRKTGLGQRTCKLTEQFRMHPDICELVNVFYDGALVSKCTAVERDQGLGLYGGKALAWIDVPREKGYEGGGGKYSISRKVEVGAVQKQLEEILGAMDRCGKKEYDIGIITFYSKQAELIQKIVDERYSDEKISVGTVDAFQGKEFDIVILSTVRSNNKPELRQRVGFLDNENRLCVAFSRAKRLLVVVGDSVTVARDGLHEIVGPLNRLLMNCEAEGKGYYAAV